DLTPAPAKGKTGDKDKGGDEPTFPTSNPLPSPVPPVPLTPRTLITPESGRYIKEVAGPDSVLEIIVGRVQIFNLTMSPKRMQIGDESVANYALLSTTELSLQGLRVGNTVLNLWFPDFEPNKTKLVSFLVRVLPDPDARDRLERAYKNLENEIN